MEQAEEEGRRLLSQADVLLIQGEDPWQDPTGGIVASTKCLMRAYGARIEVASPCEASHPTGVWLARPFEGEPVAYFNVGPLGLVRGRKPLVPAKVEVYRRIRKAMGVLHASGPRHLLLDCAEVLFAAQHFAWDSVCYGFPGLGNPVANSRYPWARIFGGLYAGMLLRSLRKIRPEAIVAAADEQAIAQFAERHGRALGGHVLQSLPTRVDPAVFYPEVREEARLRLGRDSSRLLLVVSGRLSWTKGWWLALQVLKTLTEREDGVHLVFVGDGEERSRLLKCAAKMGLSERVTITGLLPQSMVRTHLNAADVCLVTSHMEGWSLAMLEVLACGKPLVSTSVSGARAMIQEGQNGFIVRNRDPGQLADAVQKASAMPMAGRVSLKIAEKYSIETLADDFGRLWKPLAPR